MKQPKKPTRNQKELIANNGLVPQNWMVLEENREQLVIISRRSGRRRELEKCQRRKK